MWWILAFSIAGVSYAFFRAMFHVAGKADEKEERVMRALSRPMNIDIIQRPTKPAVEPCGLDCAVVATNKELS